MATARFIAIIRGFEKKYSLQSNELCTFITHFGRFGDIDIFDTQKEEIFLETKGIFIQRFYPEMKNRDLAERKSKQLTHLFEDYNHQRKLKYPTGRLKEIYCQLINVIE